MLLRLLVALIALVSPLAAAAGTLPPGFQETTALSGLTNPTVVRFAADGRIFVAEKSGLVKVFSGIGDPTETVFADLRTNVHDFWDRGLLGLALHPDFPATPWVYVLYTMDAPIGGTPPVWNDDCQYPPGATEDGCVVGARLSRLTAAGDLMTGPEEVLIEDWCQQYPSHSIGTLDFGDDGALYVSAGDGASFTFVDYGQAGLPKNPCDDPPAGVGGFETPPTAEGGALRSQDLRTLADPVGYNGTILRLDPATGAAMPDNPLVGGGDAKDDRIVAYGLRNPFRVRARPSSGEVWIGDVGWDAYEELNVLAAPTSAVQNFGWPCYEGSATQPGYEFTFLDVCTNLYATPDAVSAPLFSYHHANPVVGGDGCSTGSSAISGLAFYGGGSYPPAYDGALFFADYSRNCIWVMFAGAGGDPDPATRTSFDVGANVPVDLEIGPGGDLYYVDIFGGAVHRISYAPGNQPPVAVIDAAPTAGAVPLHVELDGAASSDPDGDAIVAYDWDLDGDGDHDDASSPTASFDYLSAATYQAGLRVTDVHGATGTAAVAITAGNTRPTVAIGAPAGTLTWNVGQTIAFSGSATDPEQGTLGAAALTWTLVIHHCPANCHTHIVQTFPGVASGSFPAPDHDYPSYLELRVTATDAGGLADTASVLLNPNGVVLSFASDPSGLMLVVGSGTGTAPFTRTVIAGSHVSVSAPAPQFLGGTPWGFDAWSDGGAQSHNLVAPAAPALYTATFAPDCASAVCGDGAVLTGCEQCDLGAGNCAPGVLCAADCTSGCRVIGRCTTSGAACADGGDCPAGEGCCGNAVVEGPEPCDDGNRLAGDCCAPSCQTEPAAACEPQSCAALGPHLAAATVKSASSKDADDNGTSERWKTQGSFVLNPAQTIDPDTETVRLEFSENGQVLYAPSLPPGTFVQKRLVCPIGWKFTNAKATLPTAVGWKSGKMKLLKPNGGASGTCSTTVQYGFTSGKSSPFVAPAGMHLRQTLRIGDDCFTALLSCTPAGSSLKCETP